MKPLLYWIILIRLQKLKPDDAVPFALAMYQVITLSKLYTDEAKRIKASYFTCTCAFYADSLLLYFRIRLHQILIKWLSNAVFSIDQYVNYCTLYSISVKLLSL